MTPYEMQSVPGARAVVNGRERDYFSGCGYLGLAGHPALAQAAIEAIQRYGLTSETSRGGYGENPVYAGFERAACRYFNAERAAYYPSGYMSSALFAQGLSGEYEHLFVDASAHFSVWDAARACGKPLTSFRHRDPADLERAIARELRPGERPLLLTDGMFPISGALAPLRQYVDVLACCDGAIIVVDDAHATGVLGANGRGTAEHLGLPPEGDPAGVRLYSAHTLSKALGGYGGLIAGSTGLIERLERGSKIGVAASPPPLPLAAASARALQLALDDPSMRERLWRNVAQARGLLRGLGWQLDDTPVPVICLGVLPGVDLGRIQAGLFERDICVAHVTTYSSTPAGGALRVAIFATHRAEQIERLAFEIGKLM